MIIGFLGKGGSGKSTLATALAKHLHASGKWVLAIDADHNMDLAYNLIGDASIPYFGESIKDINTFAGIPSDSSYKDIFYEDISPHFTLNPADSFTSSYMKEFKPRFGLMASGPHTEIVLQGNKCSHSLATSLKVYLPYLELNTDEAVIIDEKASSDAAGTGVPTGFTVSFIVAEPTIHSIKAATQIAKTLDFYEAPYEFVLNKVTTPEQKIFAVSHLPKVPLALFDFNNQTTHFSLNPVVLETLASHAETLESQNPHARKERSIKKFKLGKKYADTHHLG